MTKRQETLSAVVESERDRLLSLIRRRLRDQAEAEDVLQEVFEEYIEAYDFGTAIETLSAWLVRVAQNKILDRFRHGKTRDKYQASVLEESAAKIALEPVGPSFGPPLSPEDEWTRSWLREAIVESLGLLPPEQREVFVKHELEGKSFGQIAAETGVGLNTLLSRKRYAVRFLRNQLKEVYDELK